MLGNAQWRRLQGKCHRNQTARFAGKGETVRQERTSAQVTVRLGKPHSEQDQIGEIQGGPPFSRVRSLEVRGNVRPR